MSEDLFVKKKRSVKRDFFTDRFSDLVAPNNSTNNLSNSLSHTSSHTSSTTKNEIIQVPYIDKKTGAEYLVKTNKVNGPQGDFRISQQEAENRYKMIMGLSSPVISERQELREEEKELMPLPGLVENRVRMRAAQDVRNQESYAVTREPFHDEFSEDWKEYDHHYMDPAGRIRDKPSNTIGPFATDIKRDEYKLNKHESQSGQRDSNQSTTHLNLNGTTERNTDLEKKVGEDRGLQNLMNDTFRALFGNQVADHIVSHAEQMDKSTKVSFERPTFSRVILDSGLLKPCRDLDQHSKELLSDRTVKGDSLAYEVGLRALSALPKGPTRNELADIPKSQRDAMTVALGRTILNSFTNAPGMSTSSSRHSSEKRILDDVTKSILTSLTPNLFKGLIPSELLDVRQKHESTEQRVSGSKPSNLMERVPASEEKKYEEPRVSEPRLFFHKKKKDVFNDAIHDFDEDKPKQEINYSRENKYLQKFSL